MSIFGKVYKKLMGDDEPEPSAPAEELTKEEPMTEEPIKEAAPLDEKPEGSLELKIARLLAFDASVTDIADHLIAGRPVVLNLEEAPREAIRRILDFFSGVAYSVRGQLKRISNTIYIVTPHNVDVSHQGAGAAPDNQGEISPFGLPQSGRSTVSANI